MPAAQGFYMFVRAVQLLTQRNDGIIVVRAPRDLPFTSDLRG